MGGSFEERPHVFPYLPQADDVRDGAEQHPSSVEGKQLVALAPGVHRHAGSARDSNRRLGWLRESLGL
jgi:hypothetical protein